jgi:hypothetical protein
LVDRMAVDQIKEILLPNLKCAVKGEMKDLCHDIDLIIKKKKLQLNSRFIRIVIALSQLNLHIWNLKDRMQRESKRYDEHLRLAHQLNGIRNQLKNLLLIETKDMNKSAERTNFNTDGLDGWNISIK